MTDHHAPLHQRRAHLDSARTIRPPAANDPAANDRLADDASVGRAATADAASVAGDGDAFIIEVADEAPGLVIRERAGFRFVASDSRYASLDGRLFRDPAAAERAALDLRQRWAG